MANNDTDNTTNFDIEYPLTGYGGTPTWAALYGSAFDDVDGTLADIVGSDVITTDATADQIQTLLVDASGGAVTVTLPDPDRNVRVEVKKTDPSANSVTVATPGSETIDGQSSLTISSQYAARTIGSDGSNYFIL